MKAVQVLIVIALLGVAGYLFLMRSATTAEIPSTVQQLKFPDGTTLSVLKANVDPKGFGKAPLVYFRASEAPVKLYTYEQGEDKTFMVEGGGTKTKVPAGMVALVMGGNVKTSGTYTAKDLADANGLKMLAVKCGFDQ